MKSKIAIENSNGSTKLTMDGDHRFLVEMLAGSYEKVPEFQKVVDEALAVVVERTFYKHIKQN